MSDEIDFRTRQENLGQMVLDFPAWLSSRDKETRSNYINHISSYADAERATEKARLVNMFAVSEIKRIPLQQVVENWDTIRGGFAYEQGGDWALHANNEIGFNRMLQQNVAQQRDVRWLIEGKQDDPQSQADSLAALTFKAAALGQPSGSAFLEWDRRARSRPGYASIDSDQMERISRELHSEASNRLAPVLRLAGEAYQSLTNGQDLEDYAEVLLGRFNDLDARQQRDFLAVLRMKADAAPEQEQATFWGNMGKATDRAAGTTWRNLADAGTGFYNAAKFTVAIQLLGADPGEEFDELERKRQEHDLESDLRRIQEQNYSPIKEVMGDYMPGWVERGLYGAPQAIMSTGVALIPYVGLPATYASMTMQSYEDERFRLLDAGFSREQASSSAAKLAPIIALPNAALEKLGASAMLGRVPILKSTLTKLSDKVGGGLAGYLLRTTGGGMSELITERSQDLMTPLVESAAAALDKDMPEVVWRNGKDGVLDGFWSKTGETFVSLLPMALIGAADGGQNRVRSLHEASDLDLRAFGAREEDIAAFRLAVKQGPGSAAEAADRLLVNRDGFSDSAKTAIEEIADMERQRARITGAQLQGDLQEAGVQRIVRDKGGWTLVHASGEQTRVGSEETARAIVSDLKQAATQKEAEALVRMIDGWHNAAPKGVQRETALTGETAHSDGRKISYARDGVVTREVTSEADLRNLREQARMDAKLSGNAAIDVAINGVNYVGKIAHGARQLFQRLEINQSPSAALTFLHESIEADFRLGIKRGAISEAHAQQAIASIADAFDPKLARTEEERAFRERIQRIARRQQGDPLTRRIDDRVPMEERAGMNERVPIEAEKAPHLFGHVDSASADAYAGQPNEARSSFSLFPEFQEPAYRGTPAGRQRVRSAVKRARRDFESLGTTAKEISAEEAQALGIPRGVLFETRADGVLFVIPEHVPRSADAAMIDALLEEELVHAAHFDVLRAEHARAGNRGLTFSEFYLREANGIFDELSSTAEGRQAIKDTVNSYFGRRLPNPQFKTEAAAIQYIRSEGASPALIGELIRQLVQVRRSNRITESAVLKAVNALFKWMRATLERLRVLASDPSTASALLNAAVKKTEARLNALGSIAPTQLSEPSDGSMFSKSLAEADAQQRSQNEGLDVAAIELRETLTELAVADVLGRRKDGSTMPAGSVTASLDEAIRNTTDAAQVRVLGSVRAFLRNVRNNLRAMFGTVAALKKARRNGSTAEFDALVNKLFGKDWQAAKEWASNQEQELTSVEGSADVAFSLRKKLTKPEFLLPQKAPAVQEAKDIGLGTGRPVDVAAAGRRWLKQNASDLMARLPKSFAIGARGLGKLGQVKFEEKEDAAAHFQAVAILPELLENSEAIARIPDDSDDMAIAFMERRYGWANFPDGVRRHVLMTVRYLAKESEPPRMYSLEALEVRDAQALHDGSPSGPSGLTSGHPALETTLAEFMAGVKPEHRADKKKGGEEKDSGAAYSLSRDEDMEAAQALFGKPEQVLRDSTRSDGLIVLNADAMVERSAEMKAARTITEGQAIHKRLQPLAAKARNAALEWHLQQPITDADKLIILTAGGPGSGKSRSLIGTSAPRLVYDTNLGNAVAATKLIDQIVATNRNVQLRFVDRDFADAVRGNLERAETEKRLSTATAIAKGHFDARQSMLALIERYADNPNVKINLRRNAVEITKMTVGDFRARPRPTIDQLTKQAYEIANELERDPTISREALAIFRGGGGLEGQGGTRGGRSDQAIQRTPGGSQTPGNQPGRSPEREGAVVESGASSPSHQKRDARSGATSEQASPGAESKGPQAPQTLLDESSGKNSSGPEDKDFLLDAADSLDSYFAKYYDPSKIPALKRGLERFGVELRTNADAFLEGEGIGAAFEVAEDGRVRMSLKSNPKFRHVFHELGHFQTYLRMLKKNKGDRVKAVADYLALGKARREVEVWGRWKKHPSAWKRLDKAEKKLERDNYKRYRTMLDSNE